MIFLLKTIAIRPVGIESPCQKNKRERLFSGLNKQLILAGEFGHVSSIVLYTRTTRILSCSGYPIADGRLFSVLNLNTDIAIKRPRAYTISSLRCKRGFFIRLDNFEPCADNLWVAIVGIPIGCDETRKVVPYPRKPLG